MSAFRVAPVCAGLALFLAAPLLAQNRSAPSPAAVRRAFETITEVDYAAKLGALAHDSTRGREAPSAELDKAADWVAAQFRAAGLRPAGDSGTYLQRVSLVQTQIDSLTTITANGPGFSRTSALGSDIIFGIGGPMSDVSAAPIVLMSGIPADTSRPFGDVSVRGAVIVHVFPAALTNRRQINPVFLHASADGALAYVLVLEMPGPMWAQFRTQSFPRSWALESAPASGRRLAGYLTQLPAADPLLRAAGVDSTALTALAGQGARRLEGFTLSVATHRSVVRQAAVSNVVGVLEGSDRALRSEAVVFSSHVDHVGVTAEERCMPSRALPADSICNGADDDASGTVGVVELARAFGTLRPRPARTLVFAAFTAEELGLLGSRWYVDHPVVPLDRTAAVINLDMIARNGRDTVGLVEKDYTSLGGIVDRITSDMPELRLTPVPHPGTYSASDHFPFAQRGVPALFFFSGIYDDLHTAADNVDRADAGQAARVTRLAFLTGLDVANAAARPTWDPAARARIVTGGGH